MTAAIPKVSLLATTCCITQLASFQHEDEDNYLGCARLLHRWHFYGRELLASEQTSCAIRRWTVRGVRRVVCACLLTFFTSTCVRDGTGTRVKLCQGQDLVDAPAPVDGAKAGWTEYCPVVRDPRMTAWRRMAEPASNRIPIVTTARSTIHFTSANLAISGLDVHNIASSDR